MGRGTMLLVGALSIGIVLAATAVGTRAGEVAASEYGDEYGDAYRPVQSGSGNGSGSGNSSGGGGGGSGNSSGGGGGGSGNSSGSGSGSGGDNSSTTPMPTTTTIPMAQKLESELSSLILAGAWIPFCVVVAVAFLVSLTNVKYYQHKREREFGPTAVAVLALTTALTTLALVPVDIFLVSQQKLHSDGTYALNSDQVTSVKDLTTDAYFVMYALLLLFAFLLLPLAYFFFEEKDEEAGTSCMSRLMSSMKYTLGFLVFMAIILLIGAFAVDKKPPNCPMTLNDTKGDAKCAGAFAESAITSDSGANAISFTIGFLTVIGFTFFAMYTAIGMVTMPINMIRSRSRSSKKERQDAEEEIGMATGQRTLLLDKYGGKKKKMSSRDRNRLLKVQDRERTIQRAVSRVDRDESGMCGRLGVCCSPFTFIFGIVFFILSLILMISLMLTLADKLLNIEANNLGWEDSYSQPANSNLYPVDKVLGLAMNAFPVDYVLVSLIVYFFGAATMSGVKTLGVRFCHLQMFKIRPGRTPPQGMLFLAFILMFTMMSLNVVLMTLAPQYVTFGNQVAIDSTSCVPGNMTSELIFRRVSACSTTPCSVITKAPPQSFFSYTSLASKQTETVLVFGSKTDDINEFSASEHNHVCTSSLTDVILSALNVSGLDSEDVDLSEPLHCYTNHEPCVTTRVTALLHSFFHNMSILGAIFYYCEWLACLVYFLALIWFTCKKRKSIVQAMINDVQSDFDDSDDDMTPFKPSWK
eukprot:m.55429 g.55429  ORF g.55429 m.55429 type:complete len:753 (-) comp16876_c0_seq1:222-2480(-)